MRRDASPPRVLRLRLWFGLMGGAFAWLTHLVAAYLIAEFGCVRGWGDADALGVSYVAWLQIALTTATALAAAVATLVAWQTFRQLSPTRNRTVVAVVAERTTAWAGVATSGLFVLVILFESIPILFYLSHC